MANPTGMADPWSALAAELGGTSREESLPQGRMKVVYGELPSAEFTVLGPPDGAVILEVDFTPGEDPGALTRRILGDEGLKAAVAAAGAAGLDEERLGVRDDVASLIWPPDTARPRLADLAPVVREFVRAVTAGAPAHDRLCWACAAHEAPVARPFGQTVRFCEACVDALRAEQNREAAIRGELEQYAEDEPPPFPVPPHDPVQMNARSRQLKEEHERNPSGYWTSLLWLVALGQAALAGSALVVVALLGGVAALVWIVPKSGLAFWVGLKLVAAKGAKLLILGLAVVGGALVGLFNAVKAAFSRPPVHELDGERVERADSPRLYEWLDELARQVDAPPVDLVLLNRECNAGAAELRDGRHGFRRVVTLGIPILEMFDREELRSIMAHELGHLRHGDGRASWVYRTARSWMDMAWRLHEYEEASLLRKFADWYVPKFYLHAQVIMRKAEYEADLRARAAVDPEVCARALVKVAVLSDLYGSALGMACQRSAVAGTAAEPDLVGLAREGMALVSDSRKQKALKNALEEEPDWLDTHPVLSERLRNLGVAPPERVDLDLQPAHPATDLLDGYPDLRKRLVEPLRESLEVHLQRLHREVAACRRRLERAEEPQRAPEFTLRGRWLFRTDRDAEALASYDRALQLDPDHRMAGFERADVLLFMERTREAAEALRDLSARDPQDLVAGVRAFAAFQAAGLKEEGVECVRRMLAADPPPEVKEGLEAMLARSSA